MEVPAKIPAIVRILGKGLIFSINTSEKEVFLTFDDGPIDVLTPWVISVLEGFGARASFFLVGENIIRHPEIVKALLAAGHTIGNHTHNHIRGFSTSAANYLANVERCAVEIEKLSPGNARLFRPPYGQITPKQAFKLKEMGYRIVMWDVLSKDYDTRVLPGQCIANVVDNVTPGSIVVLHDNVKAAHNLQSSLLSILRELTQAGYRFGVL